jgi:hypothetical protein
MTDITFTTDKGSGTIHWAAAEQFNELVGKKFNLNEMEATQIEKLENLSIQAKILLSAVAGAVIQRLIDNNIETDVIFSTGSFIVNK